ncbi:MAG: restriction endonuclease subunit S, partial [Fretibacterium sp.]|nr:restriction endonuclease subunit S [Fretibacterium sp.]
IGKIGTIGNPVFVPARDDYTLSANVVLIQPKKSMISPYFLRYSFMSSYVVKQFEESKNSTSQAAFGIQKVRDIKIIDAPIGIQNRFEKCIQQTDKSKFELEQALAAAKATMKRIVEENLG